MLAKLHAISLSYRHAPMDLLAQFSMQGDTSESVYADLTRGGVRQALVLSTCNRVEIYAVCEGESILIEALKARQTGLNSAFYQYLERPKGLDAAEHLFRVAAGLESQIVGESEIQGQVRRAYDRARALGFGAGVLGQTVQAALRCGKRARAEQNSSPEVVFGRGSSLGYIHRSSPERRWKGPRKRAGEGDSLHDAGPGPNSSTSPEGPHPRMVSPEETSPRWRGLQIDSLSSLVSKRLRGNWVLVGTGQLAEELLKTSTLPEAVYSRNRKRAITLAQTVGRTGRVLDTTFDPTTEAIVWATDAPLPADFELRPGQILIDLAVPRVSRPGDLNVVSLEDLQRSHVTDARKIAEMESVVAEEFAAFRAEVIAWPVRDAVSRLHRQTKEVADAQLNWAKGELDDLTPRQQMVIEAMVARIVSRTLHTPISNLHRLGEDPRFVETVEMLYGLDSSYGVVAEGS